MIIKVKTLSGRLPRYETDGSAGMDIQAYLKEPVELNPGMRALIPTGSFMEIPSGYEVQIRAKERSCGKVRHRSYQRNRYHRQRLPGRDKNISYKLGTGKFYGK